MLVADDTEDIRILLRIVLGQSGFVIIGEATDGTEALRLWEAERDGDVFAVILDQRMPGMTGIEVAKRVLAERPDQRIILFTAHLDDDLRTEALAAGVTAVVDKDDLISIGGHPALAA